MKVGIVMASTLRQEGRFDAEHYLGPVRALDREIDRLKMRQAAMEKRREALVKERAEKLAHYNKVVKSLVTKLK